MGVTIVRGVLSTNYMHVLVEMPPHIVVMSFCATSEWNVLHEKFNRSFQHCVNDIGSGISGPGVIFVQQVVTITDEIILQYLEQHSKKH